VTGTLVRSSSRSTTWTFGIIVRKLSNRNPESRRFGLRVLGFPRFLGNCKIQILGFSTICIVGEDTTTPNQGELLIYATVPPKVRMY